MDKDYLIRLIMEYNPRLSGKPYPVPELRRDLYDVITPWMEKSQVIAIAGLRRTGKTTLMRQLIAARPGTPVFFSFDEEDVQTKEALIFVIDYALTTLHADSIFLDEIQYVVDWEGILKRYYDQKGTKFIVSGSESLGIVQANAALAGRLISFCLPPLSFAEFLKLGGTDLSVTTALLWEFPLMETLYRRNITRKEFFEQAFVDYIWKGAFPELVREEDNAVVRRYIHELVVRKIIYRDIPAITGIRRPDLLFEIFRYACSTTSQLFDVRNLSRNFGVNAETVASYLWYLRSAYLVRVAESYSGSPATRIRRNKKLSVVHPAIACAVLGYTREQVTGQILGQFAETLFAGRYFWRDRHKNEVDVVIRTGTTLVPVEIKYQSRISPADTRNLHRFMEQFGTRTGILITRDRFGREEEEGREILLIPAWLAMLAGTGQAAGEDGGSGFPRMGT